MSSTPKELDHPQADDPEELRRHVLGERGRIARLSRVREFVLGFQDGLLVPLAVVTGLAGAAVTASTVIVGGLAEAAAGALAMGTGAYLSAQAENQLFQSEIATEEAEVRSQPEIEKEELRILLLEEGLSEDSASVVTDLISTSPRSLLKTKVEKELGLSYGEATTERGDAAVVGASYLIAAFIPLWPYFFWKISTALPISLIATAVALFSLGVLKGVVARLALFRSGLQVLLIGGASAGVGYLIGEYAPRLFRS
ncbi:MAG: vacuolar iron transporter family protein [Actinomycetota bacterium]|jgi:VIT1/CCC1 family predicted Fe2+/Mn2+ transporter|nr:vacuolar iron transporter family protein [Actinomycetota bacterium]